MVGEVFGVLHVGSALEHVCRIGWCLDCVNHVHAFQSKVSGVNLSSTSLSSYETCIHGQ